MRAASGLVLLIVGCQHIPAETTTAPQQAARRAVHDATGTPQTPAGPEQFSLALEASQESSCSQSWDFSRWSAQADLKTTPAGNATLHMRVESTSTGGAWADPSAAHDHAKNGQACTFEGEVVSRGGRRSFELRLVDPEQASYECRPAYRTELDASDADPWVLDCAHDEAELPKGPQSTERTRVQVLTCRSRGNVPWLWRFVEPDGEVIRLGVRDRVHAAKHDSDSVMGQLAGVPATNGPRQWVEP